MMKVALVLLVASVLVSRSAGNPVGDTRDAKQFNSSFNAGVGTVRNCIYPPCPYHENQWSRYDIYGGNIRTPLSHIERLKETQSRATLESLGLTVYNGDIKQNNCATTGSCHGRRQGKKKRSIKDVLRSIVPQA